MSSLETNNVVVLILLDLSAAFDTVDHTILLRRLDTMFRIKDDALLWLRSYLTDRTQTVVINQAHSSTLPMEYGVPQGSVLGPKMFSFYTKPLGQIISRHQLHYHFYADDSQLYIQFKPGTLEQTHSLTILENCIADIRAWMRLNMLKLNDGKTDVMIFGTSHRLSLIPGVTINIGDDSI